MIDAMCVCVCRKGLKLPLQIKFKGQDGLDYTGLRRQTGSILLVKFQQEMPGLLQLHDDYDVNAQEEVNDADLNFSKLEERLYGIGVWCGLMLLQEEFTEPFILHHARKLRMTHPFMRGLQTVGGLGKVGFWCVFCLACLTTF